MESSQAGDYKCTVTNDRVTDGTFKNVTALPSSSAWKVSSEFYHYCGLYTYPQSSISCISNVFCFCLEAIIIFYDTLFPSNL